MLTFDELLSLLRKEALSTERISELKLSHTQYSNGFDALKSGSTAEIYDEFIHPELKRAVQSLLSTRRGLTCCEIGPGPQSVLGSLPLELRERITRYDAYEPNTIFHKRMEAWLDPTSSAESPFPNLRTNPAVYLSKFTINADSTIEAASEPVKYDMILFCHSLYGLNPKHEYLRGALEMLAEDGTIILFHRGTSLDLPNLVSQNTLFTPDGTVRVKDDDDSLDLFSSFLLGFTSSDKSEEENLNIGGRRICRDKGIREDGHPGHLSFSCPTMMATFGHSSNKLLDLMNKVPIVTDAKRVKNPEARLHKYAAIFRPTDPHQVQECVKWALDNKLRLAIVGGSHSGHCQWSNTVSVDMEAFNTIKVVKSELSDGDSFVIAGAGCKSGDIIKEAMKEGLTVPLGSRPSIGAGLWLQGGIGHLSRKYGLTSDAILGAVLVDVKSGQLLYIGNVPVDHCPAGSVRAKNEADLLWGIKGAGTNFGIVLSIIFRAFPTLVHRVQHWELRHPNTTELSVDLGLLHERVASTATRLESVDVYLYSHGQERRLAWTNIKSSITNLSFAEPVPSESDTPKDQLLGSSFVNSVDLLNSEFHMSGMHGEHRPGKTSSFKRCLLLDIRAEDVRQQLVKVTESLPSDLCYVHLLHGGGAIKDVAESATAFGCRNWEYACVITGVWKREENDSPISREVTQWVYNVVETLLPLSIGVYSADLGPDPRDSRLALKAFGPNIARLARLKASLDPYSTLRYACPLPATLYKPKMIVLVSGETCTGKDYCAKLWAEMINRSNSEHHTALVMSISKRSKQEYADATTGCDLDRLLTDRAYKEEHRGALSQFWKSQVKQDPYLPGQHFRDVVAGSGQVDVLFVTGIRDNTPVATLSPLVPECRMLEIHIRSDIKTRSSRSDGKDKLRLKVLKHTPCLEFDNTAQGKDAPITFGERYILPRLKADERKLADMVKTIPAYPRSDTDFRHILGIAERPEGLSLCTRLLQSIFSGDWSKVNSIVSCQAGGFIFASTLALQVKKPLVLIREAGKLPPPTFCVAKSTSYISGVATEASESTRLEMSRDALPNNASVVVVDDVLSTGRTLCAVLELLGNAGVSAERVRVLTVGEFPSHRGRKLLVNNGFAKCVVQSLLVYGGK